VRGLDEDIGEGGKEGNSTTRCRVRRYGAVVRSMRRARGCDAEEGSDVAVAAAT
jgi:hypothetical protein